MDAAPVGLNLVFPLCQRERRNAALFLNWQPCIFKNYTVVSERQRACVCGDSVQVETEESAELEVYAWQFAARPQTDYNCVSGSGEIRRFFGCEAGLISPSTVQSRSLKFGMTGVLSVTVEIINYRLYSKQVKAGLLWPFRLTSSQLAFCFLPFFSISTHTSSLSFPLEAKCCLVP